MEKGLSGVVLKFVKPWPRSVTRRISAVVLLLWALQMAALVNRSYLQASPNLATDLARYGSNAQWRGVYYRGEKIGFTVSQTVPVDDGFELQEDGQLQMTLLGATTLAQLRTTALVDDGFALRSFAFSLDAGTGPVEVRGRVNGRLLVLDVVTASGTRTEERELAEPPMLTLNLSRRLANGGLTSGAQARVDRVRSGDPAQRTGGRRRRAARARARRQHVDSGVPDRPGVRRPAHDLVDDRHRRGDPRGEPTRPDLRQGVGRSGAGHGGAEAGTDRPAASRGGRAGDERPHRRSPRRPPAATATGGRRSLAPGSSGRRPVGRGQRHRDSRSARSAARTPADLDIQRYLVPEPFIESDARRNRRRDGACRRRRHRRARPRRAAHAVREWPPREEADGQPSVGARGSAHQGGRLQRAHGAVCGDGPRGGHPGPGCGRSRLRARRVLLPRVARGVSE